jgi:hypothetical protein
MMIKAEKSTIRYADRLFVDLEVSFKMITSNVMKEMEPGKGRTGKKESNAVYEKSFKTLGYH